MKYSTSDNQSRFQPDSNNQVLENKLGICDVTSMRDAELHLLQQLYQAVLIEECPQQTLTVEIIKRWHYRWLGNIYEWAGQERSVNMSKGDFSFAAAPQIHRLLQHFEQDYLLPLTPCTSQSTDSLIDAIAIVHVEFILIHPFREGNGRIARLIADTMSVQANQEPLDYSLWDKNKSAYIQAIHSGLSCDYEPMKYWVNQALSHD